MNLETLRLMRDTKLSCFSMVEIRKTNPQGGKLRTPFGLCTICQVQEKPEGYQVVFLVTNKQLSKFIKRVEKEQKHD